MATDLAQALRLAVLTQPEAFGLRVEEVNPLLQLALLLAGEQGLENDPELLELCMLDCEQRLTGVVDALLGAARRPKESVGKPTASKQGGPSKSLRQGKSRATGAANSKLTVAQLRYLGFLMHTVEGRKPDYKEIQNLTAREASARISELERKRDGKAQQ